VATTKKVKMKSKKETKPRIDREKVEEAMRDYLAKGGKVNVIPTVEQEASRRVYAERNREQYEPRLSDINDDGLFDTFQ
tara:strand:+ start:279 stop:515 length:237 start_codon:yes stop_codon:yes gene_type:complete